MTVPPDLSFLKVLNPVMEAWKEVRRYGMTAERRVAVPNETAAIDARDILALVQAKIPVKMQDLVDHCDDLAENQSYANRKVALAGTKIQYPNISMPLNPWDADQYLRTPTDQKAEHQRNLENFRSHTMTIQTFCEREGLPVPSDGPGPNGEPSEVEKLAAQHALLFGNKNNVLNQPNQTV